MKILVALGGNAILKKGKSNFASMLTTIKKTSSILADLVADGNEIIITHGNGPQVGELSDKTNAPLDVCVAETQSQIGYLLQQQLSNELSKRKIKKQIVTVTTQVLVNKNDPAFKKPTKPIGLSKKRLVPSPIPIEIIEKDIIRKLFNKKMIVIASGGGGIPVVKDKGLKGVQAVIDKDIAAVLLGKIINAGVYLDLTDVDYVYLNYGKHDQKPLKKVKLKQIKKYFKQNQFPAGSMGPKIQAAIEFLEGGGRKVIITSIDKLKLALERKVGTEIVK